jgi:Zn-dependent protease
MHEFADWSVGLGRWRGVPVRIHLLFVLFAVLLLVLAGTQATFHITFASALAAGVLLGAVGIHEVGHLLVARRLGGWVNEVVIGPFGGLVRPGMPDVPRAQVLVALAGPAANLLAVALLSAVLVGLHGQAVGGLFFVLAPAEVIEGRPVIMTLKLGVWLNWLLALINLLPVYPFDGAIAFRSALRQWLGGPTAAIYVARGGFVCALGLIGLAWWLRSSEPEAASPIWVPLLVAAVFVAFSAHRDSRRYYRVHGGSQANYDDPMDIDDFIDFEEEPLEPSIAAAEAWRAESGGEPPAWRGADDDVEEAQLDDVLARLHDSGYDALSAEDRQLLDRASRRYRSRLQRRSTDDA